MSPAFLRGCRLRRRTARSLGRGGCEVVDVVLEHPRLSRITRRPHRYGETSVTWCVDGRPAGDVVEALRRLHGMPTQLDMFTPGQRP